jgi:serine/threonine protein kinase
VLDFGIAKSPGDEETDGTSDILTLEGMVVGTVPFMSPEQARGEPVDSRSDLYSLGVVMYHMATGATPLLRQTLWARSHALPRRCRCRAQPKATAHCRVSSIISLPARLEKDRNQRYPSAEELLAELREFQRSITSGRELAVGPDTRMERFGHWLSRHRWKLCRRRSALLHWPHGARCDHRRARPESARCWCRHAATCVPRHRFRISAE